MPAKPKLKRKSDAASAPAPRADRARPAAAPRVVAAPPRGAEMAAKVAAIRHAAYACFAKHGYFGTTVDLICTEAGISKGAFYWHFDSKQAAFLDILETWAAEVEHEMTRQFEAALAAPKPHAALVVALQREARRGRAIMPVWLEFLAQGLRDDGMRQAIARFHRRIREVIARLLEPALSPRFSRAQVRAFAGTLLAGFMGLVCLELGDPEEADFDGHVARLMSMVQGFAEIPRGDKRRSR